MPWLGGLPDEAPDATDQPTGAVPVSDGAGGWTYLDLDVLLASTSSGELLMQDGISSPPVPLETEDGTDWLYEG